MSVTRQLIIGILLLLAILLMESFTNVDFRIQNSLFDFTTGEWMITKPLHQKLSIIFYKDIKSLVIASGIVSLLVFGLSFRIQGLLPYRKPALLLFLSIVFVPLLVAGSKVITNVYCPRQLDIYGGLYPWVRVLEAYPEGFQQTMRGRCFPAGHATAGFAFMMLYFCFNTRRQKLIALWVAIAIGWISGIYQMLRGEHFLSHTLFTMVASWLVIIVINALVTRWCFRPSKTTFA